MSIIAARGLIAITALLLGAFLPEPAIGASTTGRFLERDITVDAKLIAPDVTVIVLKDAGHWILEERREETIAALVRFLQQ
jgi:pimeloyl-ACP methyl ester carboxylesterase